MVFCFKVIWFQLFKGDMVSIPHTSLRESVVKESAGHFGRDKTIASISSKFFWPQPKKDVANFVG